MGRVVTSHPQRAPQSVYDDLAWVAEHNADLLKNFGEVAIVVSGGRVIGAGDSYQSAVANAEENLAPEIDKVDAIVHFISRPRISGLLRRVRASGGV